MDAAGRRTLVDVFQRDRLIASRVGQRSGMSPERPLAAA
jgi:hypothetical protein